MFYVMCKIIFKKSFFDKKILFCLINSFLNRITVYILQFCYKINIYELLKSIDLPPLHNFHRLKHLLAEASDDFDSRV